jgi:hypothetical protein
MMITAEAKGSHFAAIRSLAPELLKATNKQAELVKHSLNATRADAGIAIALVDAVADIARQLAAAPT